MRIKTIYFLCFLIPHCAFFAQAQNKNNNIQKIIKVLIIDTGVSKHDLLNEFLVISPLLRDHNDEKKHGTHVAGIVLYGNHTNPEKVCKEVKIYSCKYIGTDVPFDTLTASNKCFEKAIESKFDFIVYASSGDIENKKERSLINKIARSGTKIIAAVGNHGLNILENPVYPAIYKFLDFLENVIPVANLSKAGNKSLTSNWAPGIIYDYGENIYSTFPDNKMGFLSGSSQAAAMYAHRLVKMKCANLHIKQ